MQDNLEKTRGSLKKLETVNIRGNKSMQKSLKQSE